MAERDVEAYLRKRIIAMGGLCLKFVSPGYNGVTDRLAISAMGFVYFIELKFGKNTLSAHQKKFKRELNKRNTETYTLASNEEVDDFMDNVYV